MHLNKLKTVFNISSPEKFFLVVALCFGGLFLVITPPLQGPDEQAHFIQAYRVSDLNFKSGATKSAADYPLPSSIHKTYNILFYGKNDIRFDGNRKYSLHETKATLGIPLNKGIKERSGFLTGTGYSPLSYVPQATMIAVGKLFGVAPIVLIYLARLGGLLAWIGLVYVAIRMLPIGRWPVVVISLIPMQLFQASVISADTIASALFFVYVALIMRLFVQREVIRTGQYFLIGLLAIGITLSKQVMVVMVPFALILLFKEHRADNNSGRRPILEKSKMLAQLSLVIIASLLAVGLWALVAGGSGSADSSLAAPAGVDAVRQIDHLAHEPGKFGFALWNTNLYSWGDGITRSFIGTFGWADTPMALVFTILGYFTVFIALMSNRGKDYLLAKSITRRLPRTLLLLLGFVFFLAVSAALYIYYSPVDFSIIIGLQGRYFLPILLVFALVFINNDAIQLKQNAYKLFTKTMPVFILAVSCFYIVVRYYFNTRI